MRRRAMTILGLASLALIGAACGDATATPAAPPPDLGEARAFREFPLYFAGRRSAELPLTYAEPNEFNPYSPGNPVTFGYGTCDDSQSEDGCSVPLQIQNFPAHAENAGRYRAQVRPTGSTCRRGVRVHLFGSGDSFDKALLTTGRTTVVVFAGADERLALHTIAALRSVRGGVRAGEQLAPPKRSVRDRVGPPCRRTG